MAVTITGTRTNESFGSREFRIFITYALTGTYVTGGFTTPFNTVGGGPGTSSIQSKTPLRFDWYSPLGYIYRSSVATNASTGIPTVTTKIFSAANTEFTNGSAPPDASVQCVVDCGKY